MYITSMTKPPIFNHINDSSLIQLANRVGRDTDKVPYSFVYVNSIDYPHVANVMASDPSEVTAPLNYDQIRKGIKSTCNPDSFFTKLKQIFN